MGHSLSLREGEVLATGKDSDAAEVSHEEGVGLPRQEPRADLRIGETRGMEEGTSSNAQGMVRPKGEASGITGGV